MPVLRPYQQKLVDDVREKFATHRRVLAVSPTGSGKTVTLAYITESVMAKGKRVIILAHRMEIIEQISRALYSFQVDHAVIAPGFPRRNAQVCVGMIQTVRNRIDGLQPPDLLVIDEAHHAVSTTYRRVTDAWPGCRVMGVTATPIRLDGTGLHYDFDAMVLGPSVADLIEQGHLARFRHIAPEMALNMSGIDDVDTVRGRDAIGEQLNQGRIVGDVVAHYRHYLDGRPAIAFLPNVSSAERFAAMFSDSGIPAVSVDGKISASERSRRVRGLADGSVRVLTNCDLLGEGFDVPSVAGAILLRPTQSLSLYMQQCGRALRPKPDGSPAVILDHVGNVNRGHGTVDAPRDWSLAGRPKKPPSLQTCSTCYRCFEHGTAATIARVECERRDVCPYLAPPAPRETEQDETTVAEDGELVEVGFVAGKNPVLDPALRRYRELKIDQLLSEARTRSDIELIARARGYSKKWVSRHAQLSF